MKLARLATTAIGIVLAMALAACGSSQKTVEQSPSAGGGGSAEGALVGVDGHIRRDPRLVQRPAVRPIADPPRQVNHDLTGQLQLPRVAARAGRAIAHRRDLLSHRQHGRE